MYLNIKLTIAILAKGERKSLLFKITLLVNLLGPKKLWYR